MSGASANVKAGRAFIEIALDQGPLEQGLKKAQRKLKSFSSAAMTVGKDLVMLSLIAAAPIAYATKTFADFDDQMRMVKAVTQATEAQFVSLTNKAKKLGRETSFTAKQVAEGMTALGRMGFLPDEIEQAIPAVLDLSRATGTELGDAAEIAANNMRVFGIETGKITSVVDILTVTANGSAQTLIDLSEGLKMAGPQAAAAKDNIVNVSAALGVLANMGIRGSLAGTALRKAYSQFAKADITAKLNGIGIATTDANGNLRSMPDIMTDIAKAMEKMPTAKRLNFAEEIFDLRGSLAGLQLGGNIEQLDKFIKKLNDVNGAASKTATEMDAGIGGAFRRLLSAVEGVQLAIGEIVSKAIAPYIEKVSKMLNQVAEWIGKNKALVLIVVKAIAAVAAFGAALIAVAAIAKVIAFAVGGFCVILSILKTVVLAPILAIKGLIAVFTLLKAVMIGVKIASLATWAAISSPIFLVTLGVTALVAAMWKLTGAWDICANAAKGLAGDFSTAFSSISNIVGQTWPVIKAALAAGDLAGAAKVGLAALKVVWLEGLFPLQKAWLDLKNFLADSWTVSVYSILKLGNNLWYGLLMGLQQVGDGIADAWSFIWDGVIGAFESTVAYLKKKWIEFKGFFDSDVNVDAEIKRVDDEMAANKSAREQQSADAVNRRAAGRDKLNKEWDSSNQAIDEAMGQEIGENKKAYRDALGKAAAEIEAARGEWKSVMDDVKKRTEQKAAEAAGAAKGTEKAQTGLGVVGDKAVGGWSLKALDSMLGGGSAQERTAKATEASAIQARETNKHLKNIEKGDSALSYGE